MPRTGAVFGECAAFIRENARISMTNFIGAQFRPISCQKNPQHPSRTRDGQEYRPI
jgi:hypothetical protein